MGETTTKPAGLKGRLAAELHQFLILSLYLTVFFAVFRWYTRLLLAEYHVPSVAYGFTILQSLALAKIILTGEALHLGARFHGRPLLLVTVIKALIFCAFYCVFEIVEHVIIGGLRGKGFSEILEDLLERGWVHIFAVTLVVFVAFLPQFAFRELGRVLGEGKLHALFFKGELPEST
jgi:hypothetical protein